MSIELSSYVRDTVTGFEGLAVARMDKLFGEPEIQILPRGLDGEGDPRSPYWFEESRLEVMVPAPLETEH